MDSLHISAKTLAQLALPDACQRCFWLKHQLKNLPWNIFPGIFNSIDSYSKNAVASYFERHKTAPTWLDAAGELKAFRKPPHFSKFNTLDAESDILLTGQMDACFDLADGTLFLPDFKCSKFTPAQEKLHPLYEAQLNAYAHIAEATKFGEVSRLALIYTEPFADAAAHDEIHLSTSFQMEFKVNARPVERKRDLTITLLQTAAKILRGYLPDPQAECRDCGAVAGLLKLHAPTVEDAAA